MSAATGVGTRGSPPGLDRPAVVTLVFAGTANHYLLDAVAGAAFALSSASAGPTRPPRHLPRKRPQ